MRGPLARRVRLGVVLYGAMVVLALVIAWWREDSLLFQPAVLPPGLPSWLVASPLTVTLISVVGGVALAGLTVASTEWLVRRTAWARALRAEFRSALEGATPPEIAVLALASGTAEELLFRGALQPALGLAWTSLLFGAVHFVPSRRLLPWTAWAGVMGVLLGLLYERTGSIAGCVVAHVAINAINLGRIVRFDPTLDEDHPLAPPSLVDRRRTRSRG
jgi:membrane protease YdiL (CAAX protease family)